MRRWKCSHKVIKNIAASSSFQSPKPSYSWRSDFAEQAEAAKKHSTPFQGTSKLYLTHSKPSKTESFSKSCSMNDANNNPFNLVNSLSRQDTSGYATMSKSLEPKVEPWNHIRSPYKFFPVDTSNKNFTLFSHSKAYFDNKEKTSKQSTPEVTPVCTKNRLERLRLMQMGLISDSFTDFKPADSKHSTPYKKYL